MLDVIILPIPSSLVRTSASKLGFLFDAWTFLIHRRQGPCDRFAATMKNHVRSYVNEGHVVTTDQFQEALLSHGGVPGARLALLPDPVCDKLDVKWPGISKVNNFEFTSEGVKVWRVYQVGEGKLLPWSKFEGKIATTMICYKYFKFNCS